jgi:hypothetical protein
MHCMQWIMQTWLFQFRFGKVQLEVVLCEHLYYVLCKKLRNVWIFSVKSVGVENKKGRNANTFHRNIRFINDVAN